MLRKPERLGCMPGENTSLENNERRKETIYTERIETTPPPADLSPTVPVDTLFLCLYIQTMR
jgi:hypothetical protein